MIVLRGDISHEPGLGIHAPHVGLSEKGEEVDGMLGRLLGKLTSHLAKREIRFKRFRCFDSQYQKHRRNKKGNLFVHLRFHELSPRK